MVTGPLASVRAFFVAPSAAARPAVVRPPTAPASFAVLGERREALSIASALVLTHGGGCGLVCVWPPGDTRPRVPATARARRLAARLQARGLSATAAGRLVRVPLPAPATEAVATAQRAVGAADVPSAVVLAGPRDDALDTVLSLQDAIVLVVRGPADSPLVRLAVSGLGVVAVPVVTVSAPSGPMRELATAGLVAPPGLRGVLEPALALSGAGASR